MYFFILFLCNILYKMGIFRDRIGGFSDLFGLVGTKKGLLFLARKDKKLVVMQK